ncbi:MAG: peptide chain release factor N(5)-glutamine methyltransferase [Clostridia bacterium]|nr:peptide chain release factor N(5)-glutamine methyltransferase [Clostridia bacterium]
MSDKVSSIGGQALMEGVMMRGPSSMAMSVRDEDGNIQTESERLKPQRWYNKAPIIRGIVSFVSSLTVGVSTLTRSAKVLDEDEELSDGAMTFAVVLGVLFAVALFMVLPELAARAFNEYVYDNVLTKSLISGAIRIIIFVVYLALVSKMKDIKRTFMYHGAEHKTINCYESGMPLTVENVQKCSTRHNRCGTTFLFIVMIISILIFAVVNWLLVIVFGDSLGGGVVEAIVFIAIKLVFLPLVAGVSYEVLKGVAKMPNNTLAKILRAPGLALQGLTTANPDDDMVEVAIKSFVTVMKMEQDPTAPICKFGEITVSDAKAYVRRELAFAEPVEAEWILCEVLKVNRAKLAVVDKISLDEFNKVKKICLRRKAGEPLDYITSSSNFYGYDVYVDKRVLIPRMDTEILVSEAIKAIGDKDYEVLDLCTGSGCIALAIASKTRARVTASDISDDALSVAAKNLAQTDVTLIWSDLMSEFAYGSFDIIVSNPPYIPSGDIVSLSPEVRSEPRIALDGGDDGLEFYKKIISAAPNYLRSGGKLMLEIGYDQASSVKQLMYVFGFKNVMVVKDLDGNDRVVIGQIQHELR